MADLDITEYTTYEEFAQEWRTSASDLELLWQLLGQLDTDELLIVIPEWLADEKVGFVEGATPTLFIGRIERETEKAIRFTDAAAARPLMKLAHRIHNLEQNTSDADRNKWLAKRHQKLHREFQERHEAAVLADEWLPKSQIHRAGRRQQ